MRIAYLNPTILMRRPIAELAAACAAVSDEVTVITPQERGKQPEARRADHLLKRPGVTVVPIWSIELKKILWSIPTDREFVAKLRKIIQTHDILHLWAPYYPIALMALVIAWLSPRPRARIIITFDTIPGRSFSMGWLWDLLFWLYHATLAGFFNSVASHLTLYGESLRPYAKSAGLRPEKTAVIPSGIFLGEHPKKQSATRAGLITVLFVGLLNRRKGIDTLLAVARQMKTDQLVMSFIVVGSSAQESFWRAEAERMGLVSTVEFVGSQKGVDRFYNKADIFFLPSRGEGLPGVVMEAMHFRLPVVASDIPCLPDLVAIGQSGYLSPMEDVNQFVANLRQLAGSKELRHRFGARGHRRIQEYDWQHVLPKYRMLYEEIQ